VCSSYHAVSERMAELRSENEDLRSTAVVADESYHKLVADNHMMEMDLNQVKEDNCRLVQQVYCCQSIHILSIFHSLYLAQLA